MSGRFKGELSLGYVIANDMIDHRSGTKHPIACRFGVLILGVGRHENVLLGSRDEKKHGNDSHETTESRDGPGVRKEGRKRKPMLFKMAD